MAGKSFCISYASPNDLKTCILIGQALMLDNGAFSVWTRKATPNWPGFYRWCEPVIGPLHWAVVPDVIDGTVEDNMALASQWPHRKEWSAIVWHLHEPLDHLAYLADNWPRVCFGSSGAYADPNSDAWHERIDCAWNMLVKTGRRPWVHMLRAMSQACDGPWPFSSADSTNVARNHNGSSQREPKVAVEMANEIDAKQPPLNWNLKPEQMELIA
jgi:hypothetical protein